MELAKLRAAAHAALFGGLLALAAAPAWSQAPAEIPVAPAPAVEEDWRTATELEKVDFTGLTAEQKQTALTILREEGCNCGCGMKIAECRVRDRNCPRSPGLAASVVQGVKEGKSRADIVSSLAAAQPAPQAPPQAQVTPPPLLSGDKVEIPIKGAPFKGPETAKVVFVEFSDFQ